MILLDDRRNPATGRQVPAPGPDDEEDGRRRPLRFRDVLGGILDIVSIIAFVFLMIGLGLYGNADAWPATCPGVCRTSP